MDAVLDWLLECRFGSLRGAPMHLIPQIHCLIFIDVDISIELGEVTSMLQIAVISSCVCRCASCCRPIQVFQPEIKAHSRSCSSLYRVYFWGEFRHAFIITHLSSVIYHIHHDTQNLPSKDASIVEECLNISINTPAAA